MTCLHGWLLYCLNINQTDVELLLSTNEYLLLQLETNLDLLFLLGFFLDVLSVVQRNII
ncbi:unnamed protein product, partial [Diabrotica balteata]